MPQLHTPDNPKSNFFVGARWYGPYRNRKVRNKETFMNMPSASRVAKMHLANFKHWNYGGDLVARLMVLAGAAGVKPHKWAKPILGGKREVGRLTRMTIMDHFPKLDPAWLELAPAGLTKVTWVAAHKLLKHNPHWSADHVVSIFLTGSSAKGNAAEGLEVTEALEKSAYYRIGQGGAIKAQIARGKGPEITLPHCKKWGFRRAQDLLDSVSREHAEHGDRVDIGRPNEDGQGTWDVGTHELAEVDSLSGAVADVVLNSDTRYGRELQRMLQDFWSRASAHGPAIMANYIAGKSNAASAKELGVSGMQVGRILKKLEPATVAFLGRGKAKDLVEQIMEIEGAGLGYSTRRAASDSPTTDAIAALQKELTTIKHKAFIRLNREHMKRLDLAGWVVKGTDHDMDRMDFRYKCVRDSKGVRGEPQYRIHGRPGEDASDIAISILGYDWFGTDEGNHVVFEFESDWR